MTRGSRRGGGVAIVWKNSKINLVQHNIKCKEFEMIAAKGKVAAAERNVYVFAVYYPPSLTAEAVEKFNNIVCEEIEKIKTVDPGCIIIIGGDTNRKDCSNQLPTGKEWYSCR